MIALPLSIKDAMKLTNLGIKREVENERRRLEREHETCPTINLESPTTPASKA